MNALVDIITARDPKIRDQSLEVFCRSASAGGLLAACDELDRFRRTSDNLYERVRAQFFLYAIHRFYLPLLRGIPDRHSIAFPGNGRTKWRSLQRARGGLPRSGLPNARQSGTPQCALRAG